MQSTRESTETAAENKGEFEAIQSLMRRQLEEREQAVTELQTTVSAVARPDERCTGGSPPRRKTGRDEAYHMKIARMQPSPCRCPYRF
ncbi:MAG: hypothetical protein ACPIOQ_18835 [Promethearchaeia archaeon]